MKEFLKKYKKYIAIGVIAILVGSFSYWGIFCSIKRIRNNADEVQKKIIDSEINQKKFAKIPQMQKTFGELGDQEKKLVGVLKEEEEVDFIKKMEILAEETQNKIDLKIIEGEQREGVKTKTKNELKIDLPSDDYISLQANLTGNYSNLYNFIKKLENFEYYVNIVSINSSVEEDKAIRTISSDNPFIASGGIIKSPVSAEAGPKLLLKTQINFVAYIIKK